MGLDSYLLKRPISDKAKIALAIEGVNTKESIELAYWRKQYTLTDKFLTYATEEQAEENDGDLNCKEIILSKEDLIDMLEWVESILAKDEFKEKWDKEAFKKAQVALSTELNEHDPDNYEILFYAWW